LKKALPDDFGGAFIFVPFYEKLTTPPFSAVNGEVGFGGSIYPLDILIYFLHH
jgi:hypothetical protein